MTDDKLPIVIYRKILLGEEKKSPLPSKGGRPRRVPGERLERITLNLRPVVLFGLELIARDRGASLSQAAEFAISKILREYDIDGQSAFELAVEVKDIAVHEREEGNPELLPVEVQKSFFRQSPLWRAHKIPPRLRTLEEKFLAQVMKASGKIPLGTDDFYAVAKEGYETGLSASEVAKKWKEMTNPKAPPTAAK